MDSETNETNEGVDSSNSALSKTFRESELIDCKIEIDLNMDTDPSALLLPKLTRNASEIINENNKSGYCIDSVEPKCYELKRYINEFKQNFEIKWTNLKRNKNLYEQIHVLKDYYLKGMELFNEQQILNMNTEKSKKYLNDINIWQSSLNELSINDEYKNMFKNLSSSTTVLFEQQQQQQQHHEANTISNNNANGILINTNTNLKLNMQEVSNQLKSLIIMFNKRSDQLKKIAYPSANKPIQRVQPQKSSADNKNNSSEMLNVVSKTSNKRNGIKMNFNTERKNSLSSNSSSIVKSLSESSTSSDDIVLDEEYVKNCEKKQK